MVFKRTGFIQSRDAMHCVSTKSRRDDTLLTVDFNLRTEYATCAIQSPAGTAQWIDKVSSLRDFAAYSSCWLFRRLKSTVNKVLSPAGHFIADTIFLQVIYFPFLKFNV